MIAFKLPSLGSDMDQGKLLEWKVKPGDGVKRGQVVAVVDTSKAAVDVEIWDEGTVHELVVQPGETVPVGTVLATLLAPGETPETAVPLAPEAPAAAPRPGAAPLRRRISPAARKRAEELGVDLERLAGSGPEGAVTLQDVEQAAAAKGLPEDRQTQMRKAIAAAMSRSKREIPHYYLSETVPLETATAWLQAQNAALPVTGRLLMAVLFLKAVALACRRYPEMNGHYREGGFQPGVSVHAGVAISLRQGGLVAPAIHDVQDKTPAQLMGDLTDLVQRARAGSLRSSEMSDPTITVTNLGDQGVDSVTGVIYPPQVALVGFGRVTERPWAEQGALRVLPAVTVSLAADHRVSDGHRGALFLAQVRSLLQEPQKL
ncbi:MAG: dihydrolipoamide acetyltransferase family protein [Pseudomonadota bacterium]